MQERLPQTPGIYAWWRLNEDGSIKNGYVGSAVRLRNRKSVHLTHLRHNEHHFPKFQRAWNKNSESRFTFEILEHVEDKCDLTAREQFWIDSLIAELGRDFLLNVSLVAGRVEHDQDFRNRLAERNRNRVWTEETRERASESHKGYVPTEESKAKVSETLRKIGHRPPATAVEAARRANTGRPLSPERCAKIGAAAKGRPNPKLSEKKRGIPLPRHVTEASRSPEAIAKRVAKLKGRPPPAAAVAAAKAANTGRRHPVESKEKMAAARKAFWDRKKSADQAVNAS